jgi:superfamily I DNA and/or RNA helicase
VYDYFRHNLLSSMLALYGDTVPKVMLKEHYRCHPRIIEFCNQKYYDGKLIAFTTEGENDNPLLIYLTAPGNHMREVTYGRKGKFNQRELDVIQQEVTVDLPAAMRRHPDIGFVTPYRKQVEDSQRVI